MTDPTPSQLAERHLDAARAALLVGDVAMARRHLREADRALFHAQASRVKEDAE